MKKIQKMFPLWIIITWELWLKYLLPLPIKKSDITNVLVLVYVLYSIIKNPIVQKRILIIVGGFVGIVVTSAISANVLFGQSFMDGVIVLRHTFIQLLIAIPISQSIKKQEIAVPELLKVIVGSIRIACIVYLLHYMIYQFTEILILDIEPSTHLRYGSVRFYFYFIMPVFLLAYTSNQIVAGKWTLTNIIDVFLVLANVMFVGKMRMTTLASLVAVAIGVLVYKKIGWKKIFYVVCGIGVVIVIVTTTEMGQDILEILSGQEDVSAIRTVGRIKHINSFLKHPIWGLGYPHENCLKAMKEFGTSTTQMIDGTYQAIYIGDNGIFDYLYIFGLSGVVWLVYWFINLYKQSVKILKSKNDITYLIFLFFLIISSPTELNWFHGGTLFMGILTGILLNEKIKDKR